jgi:superfamily I DNA/RNA helicase
MAACRRTSDFAGLLPPNRIMAVMWSNKRMRNFMKNRIANMVFFGIANIKP